MTSMSIPVARLPPAYRLWNELLARQLFPPGRPGSPVYLAVHDRLLNECGARNGVGGRDDFIRAVLDVSPTPGRLFVCLEELATFWADDDEGCGTPPIIAGLAFAVLAASEMEKDEDAPQHNYYIRLNALMGIENRSRPERFESTRELWRLLQDWLRRERRGELVVHGLDSEHRPFVGPVESQCLIRSCDIEDLLPILRPSDRPSAPPEPEDLVPSLRTWLARDGTGSRLAGLLGRDPDDAALLQTAEAFCDAVEDYAAEQPQAAAAISAGRTQHAALAVRPNRYPKWKWKLAQWLIRLPASAEAEEAECLAVVGDRVVVARLDVREPAGYDADITHDEAIALLRGEIRVFDDEENDITLPPASLVWFEDGALRGRSGSWCWAESPEAGTEYAAVSLEQETLSSFQAALERPLQPIAGEAAVWPGTGAHVAFGAVLQANAVLPGGVAVRVRSSALRFRGGLRIARRVYLRGGLPRPVLPDTAVICVEDLNGASAPQEVAAPTFASMDLAEGRYAIRCDGATAEIFVREPRWRECAVHPEAPLDHQVRRALAGAALRGASLAAEQQLYAEHFAPGTRYRLYAPHVVKGFAPADSGVHEHRTEYPPRQVVIMKRVPAKPPLPPAECFSETGGDVAQHTVEQRGRINQLLEYVSARGAGTVDSIRDLCGEIVGDAVGAAWHTALSTLEDLGHIDVSWEARTWAAAPAYAMPRLRADGSAIFAGARSQQAIAWLRERGIEARADERAGDGERSAMPDCIVAPAAALAGAAALIEAGVRWLPEAPAMQMALHVHRVSEREWWLGPQFSPPLARIQQTLQCWDHQLLRWSRATDLEKPGLYSWQQHGRRFHYLAAGGAGARVRDPAAAKWFLAPPDRSYLVYEGAARRLLVPVAIELPRIWKRICALASGLMPARRGRVLVYDDIPIELARAAAVRLNQSRTEGIL